MEIRRGGLDLGGCEPPDVGAKMESGSSTQTAGTRNCWALSPAQYWFLSHTLVSKPHVLRRCTAVHIFSKRVRLPAFLRLNVLSVPHAVLCYLRGWKQFFICSLYIYALVCVFRNTEFKFVLINYNLTFVCIFMLLRVYVKSSQYKVT